MTTYNCKHSGDQYSITKFNRHGEVESSYLCDHVSCQCPAGVRDTCRHRRMLPIFLEHDLVNSHLFLDWDNGRQQGRHHTAQIVDFNGLPATAPTRIVDEDDVEIIHPGSLVHTRDGYIEHGGGVDARDVTPATVQSNEASTIDLAPQAHTDTDAPTNLTATEIDERMAALPVPGEALLVDAVDRAHRALGLVAPAAGVTSGSIKPANPNGWRRF